MRQVEPTPADLRVLGELKVNHRFWVENAQYIEGEWYLDRYWDKLFQCLKVSPNGEVEVADYAGTIRKHNTPISRHIVWLERIKER